MSEIDRAQIATTAGLPAGFGERLRGETTDELEADARAVAETLGVSPEPEYVRLARRAMEAAENNPNKAELAALAAGSTKNAGLLRLLGLEDGEQ